MFDLLWRTLRKNIVGPSGGERLAKGRHVSFRPQLEVLEDRAMPSLWPGVLPPPGGTPTSGSTSNPQSLIVPPPKSAHQYMVAVTENSPDTVINLDQVFAQISGLQYQDGLQWTMLGNNNSALVKTDLSESELTLTYASGKYGTATITVAATDADGVSQQESVLVWVKP